MKKKIIFYGSFFAVFLVMMIPVVGAVEYNQLNNVITEKTNWLDDYKTNKRKFITYKEVNSENLNLIIDQFVNNVNDICLSCEAGNSECFDYFLAFFLLMFVGCLISMTFVGLLPGALMMAYAIQDFYEPAKELDCLWTRIFDMFAFFFLHIVVPFLQFIVFKLLVPLIQL